MPVVCVRAVCVFCQYAAHELTYTHMDEFRDLLHHDFAIYPVLSLIELIFSPLFLYIEHDSSCVSEALPHTLFQLMVFIVRVTLVMLRAIFVLMFLLNLTLFFAPLQKL